MMKLTLTKIHFPTALGLLILLVAAGVGLFLVQTRTGVETGAEADLTPSQVRITNVTDTSFSASWTTGKEVFGSIKYGGATTEIRQTALDDRDQLTGDAGAFGG